VSQFINYQKRGVELPEGCKDLIDVLKLANQESLPEPDRTLVEGLADIEGYLSRMLASPAKSKFLAIFCFDPKPRTMLHFLSFGGVIHASLSVACTDPDRERAVRAVFAHAGIAPVQDLAVHVWGHAEAESRSLRYPLPATAREAAGIIIELLRTAYGLPETAKLGFKYREMPGLSSTHGASLSS